MKLEVTIKADRVPDELLGKKLACLVPAGCMKKTFNLNQGNFFTLKFSVETQTPDVFLRKLESAAADSEKSFPEAAPLELDVKNTETSEPTFDREDESSAFVPVAGIRIVPLPHGRSMPRTEGDIFLDSAGVFGSGLHPSTHLCLQLLQLFAERAAEKNLQSGSVLDIGCGSGILTLAALRLGAARALGLEIDKQAASTARRNIDINGLVDRARVLQASWQEVTGQFDLILANLVPSVLFRAIPAMPKLLAEHGLIITAGFPAAQNKKICKRLEEKGLHLLTESSRHGWGALLLRR